MLSYFFLTVKCAFLNGKKINTRFTQLSKMIKKKYKNQTVLTSIVMTSAKFGYVFCDKYVY